MLFKITSLILLAFSIFRPFFQAIISVLSQIRWPAFYVLRGALL
jgi:hypothetical protein